MARRRRRQYRRFVKRVEVLVRAGEKTLKTFSSDISEWGIFIRTNRGLPPGSVLHLEMKLPDDSVSFLKGIVRWTLKTGVSSFKNGMGVELLEVDERFKTFFEKEFIEVLETDLEMFHEKAQVSRDADFLIVPCEECNTRNKIPKEKINLKPRCGKCGSLLHL